MSFHLHLTIYSFHGEIASDVKSVDSLLAWLIFIYIFLLLWNRLEGNPERCTVQAHPFLCKVSAKCFTTQDFLSFGFGESQAWWQKPKKYYTNYLGLFHILLSFIFLALFFFSFHYVSVYQSNWLSRKPLNLFKEAISVTDRAISFTAPCVDPGIGVEQPIRC